MASDLTICPIALRSSVTAALTEVLSVRTGDMERGLGSHSPQKTLVLVAGSKATVWSSFT